MKDRSKQDSPAADAAAQPHGGGTGLPKSLTYAAVIDVRNVEHEITDFMVRRACAEMDKIQQFPFAPRR